MSLLDERDLTAAERAAIADEPRPGVWIEEHDTPADLVGDVLVQRLGDGRTLTQHETDLLVVRELWNDAPHASAQQDALRPAVVAWLKPSMVRLTGDERVAHQQRGGIHSDQLVRLLAYRAWGERDRQWFDTLHVGQQVFIDANGHVTARRPAKEAMTVGWVHAGPHEDGTIDIRSTPGSYRPIVTRFRVS